MRRLWPDPDDEVDAAALVAADERPPHADRPWLAVNMITSLDGAIALTGRSGGLGRPADKEMFRALRAIADVVLVGAGTVRAERYGPPRPSPERRADRRARGQAESPRLAIVSTSLALDLDAPLFADAEQPPLLVTSERSPADRRAAAAGVAEVVIAGDDEVDLGRALSLLRERGAGVVLAEGGPHLNGGLVAAGLVDEWNLTVSPLLAAGEGGPVATAPPIAAPTALWLDRVLEGDGLLFLRHVRVEM